MERSPWALNFLHESKFFLDPERVEGLLCVYLLISNNSKQKTLEPSTLAF